MSTKRWIVTFTKHMKQKRKVYQDGVLELCSSSDKPQVMLYDDCEKLIDKRFLKKDERIKSGGTLSFETHIVDIGDPDGNNKPSAESSVKSVIRPESQKEKLCVEWNVLYSTHMTQKTKKYHDGILRALTCSSHLNLITLLNEDGAILSSKYLKSVSCLETGKNCEFPNYLVEICEKRDSVAGQGGYDNARSSCKDLHMKDSVNQVVSSKPEKCDKRVTSRKDCKIPLSSVPKKETSGCRTSNAGSAAPSNLPMDLSKKVANYCNSKMGSFINSSTAPLRDAGQILSVLKKPSPDGSVVLWDPLVEQGFTPQSSDRCQFDLQSKLEQGFIPESSDRCQLDLQMSSEKTGSSACQDLKSANSQEDSISAAYLVLEADSEGITSENDHGSSIWSSGSGALDTSTKSSINSTGGYTGVTIKVSEVLGDPMLPGCSQTNKPDKFISDIGFSPEVIHNIKPIVPLQNSSGALDGKQHLSASTCSLLKDNLVSNESSLHGMTTGISSDSTSDQLCVNTQTGERYESVSLAVAPSTFHATSDSTKDPVIPSSVELANLEDCPTFDLGL